jgi:lipoic acid synthetase
VVITSVCRDDLADGGAGQFVKTIELIHQVNKDIKVEILIPDFQANTSSLKCVLDVGPFVTAHNIETVRRLYDVLRPQADYGLSLEVLSKIKEIKPAMTTKSSLMLGLGETEEEVTGTMADLRKHECDILTLGQYLAPSALHYPVKEFIPIEQFRRYHKTALSMGFGAVLSGPCVRSSYQAEGLSKELMHA